MNITSDQIRQAILRKPELKTVFGNNGYGTPTSGPWAGKTVYDWAQLWGATDLPDVFGGQAQSKPNASASTPAKTDYSNQIIQIYQQNFGRYPTQKELADQQEAIQSGRLSVEGLTTWAQTSPENVQKTGTVSTPQKGWGSPIDVDEAVSKLPESIRNSEAFQSLPDDMKKMAAYNYTIQTENDKVAAERLNAALEEAKKQADPYWKGIVRITQDELTRGVSDVETDYQTTKQKLEKQIKELQEDLASGKDYLSLEEQSELANLEASYEQDLKKLGETAASKGLTFSTIREEAETQAEEENQALVESTQRQYGYKQKELENEVLRGVDTAKINLEAAGKAKTSDITKLGRTAEKYLGSSNLPGISGYNAMGDVTGTMEQDKVQDIFTRAKALASELKLPELNY